MAPSTCTPFGGLVDGRDGRAPQRRHRGPRPPPSRPRRGAAAGDERRRPAGRWWRGSGAPCRRSRPGTADVPTAGWCRCAWTPSCRPPPTNRPARCRPNSPNSPRRCWYTAVTPSSLKRAATVPNTGRSSSGASNSLVVAGVLTAHVAQRILRTAALELVDHHDLGLVEHVDLLELRGRTELGRHHVDGQIDVGHDGRVALADAGRLDHHQVGTPGLRRDDRRPQRARHGDAHRVVTRAGGQRAEEHLRAVERVHADAIAQQRAATATAGGVDGDDRDAHLVGLVETEPAQQFVGERRLPGTTGARDAHHRHRATQPRRRRAPPVATRPAHPTR